MITYSFLHHIENTFANADNSAHCSSLIQVQSSIAGECQGGGGGGSLHRGGPVRRL